MPLPYPDRRIPTRSTTVRTRIRVLAAALTGAVLLVPGTPALAGPEQPAPRGPIGSAGGATAIADSYIVTLRDSYVAARRAPVADNRGATDGRGASRAGDRRAVVTAAARTLAGRYGASIQRVYADALVGFEAVLPESAARRLAADAAVASVEQNHRVSLAGAGVQINPPSWGLDRIDQRYLPLDQRYAYPNTAPNVHAYIIDTGIRATHRDFGGRVAAGIDLVDGGPADDCNGHGTFLAGIVGGTAHGVAKEVRLVPVRVLSCAGSGSYAQVIAGVDWVTGNAVRPAVVNMGLGGNASAALDAAINRSISSGITYAVAAGSSNTTACNTSPARVPAVLTVAGTTPTDARMSSGNYGACLDLFAPGQNITSTWHTGDTATVTISGTAMASAHVAGCAAVVASAHPGWTPAQVTAHLVGVATPNVVGNAGADSPNRLLYCVA